MLAILDQVELGSDHYEDKTDKYLTLVLLKLGLDAGAFYFCSKKVYTCVFTMCSLSIVLADAVLACSLAGLRLAGADRSPAALCFLLANASAAYGVLPLPAMLLGSLDYYLYGFGVCDGGAPAKRARVIALVSLGWVLAVLRSLSYVDVEVKELSYRTMRVRACDMEESLPISLFGLTLFVAFACMMLPFLPWVPQWVREADRLSQVREGQESHSSDLFVTVDRQDEGGTCPARATPERPPLWIGLAMGFGMLWIPYLAMLLACLLLDVGLPAYITINVLWLECTNSFLAGFMFRMSSSKEGPYSQLPGNLCFWKVLWHLSNDTREQTLPVAIFNPTKEKGTSF